MNWKNFLFLPIAAIAAGVPFSPPSIKKHLPIIRKEGCDQALRYYLQAYAYSREQPAVAWRFLNLAEHELRSCPEEALPLPQRILSLRSFLFP